MKSMNRSLAVAVAAAAIGWVMAMNLVDPSGSEASAQAGFEPNYEEAKVPAYTLPDPLALPGRPPVTSAADWRARGRGEVWELFAEQVYGRAPERPAELQFLRPRADERALDGMAIRREVIVRVGTAAQHLDIHLLIYFPQEVARPVPCFVGLNFRGNHTIQDDPGITIYPQWVRDTGGAESSQLPSEETRGSQKSRWSVADILHRGYAVATAYYGDIDPDYHDGFRNGIHALYPAGPPGAARPANAWGSIAAWAWGLSRIVDYLETDPDIQSARIALMGHSRLGKTALWAGATDERFSIVISNDSGCGGAALSRREFGETVGRINTSFPHWFCDNFKQYNQRVAECPVDQHMLIALVAPRPVLVCSAEEDRWADPHGEFLGAQGADAVYRLLGTDGMAATSMPGVNELVRSRIGYHIRPGQHDVLASDWQVYMDFAAQHWRD